MENIEGRVCNKCSTYKTRINFNLCKKYGLYSTCKQCKKEYRIKNKDKISQWHKNNYKDNKEKINKRNNEYNKNNVEKLRLNSIKNNKHYRSNPENKEKIKKYKREYYHKKKSDPMYFLSIKVRNRLRAALNSKNWRKNISFNQYIGCSLEELKQHLEKQFKDNMSWENYGHSGWHIDHIIPLSSAKTKEELYELCHYTNLQPLWAKDNYKKSDGLWHQV